MLPEPRKGKEWRRNEEYGDKKNDERQAERKEEVTDLKKRQKKKRLQREKQDTSCVIGSHKQSLCQLSYLL